MLSWLNLLPLLLTAFLGVQLFIETSADNTGFYSRHKKQFFYAATGCVALLFVCLVLAAANTGWFDQVKNLSVICFACGAVFYVLSLLWSTTALHSSRFGKVYRFAARSAVVVILLELSIFNFNGYHMISGNDQRAEITNSQVSLTHFVNTPEGFQTEKEGTATIEIPSIDMPVATVKIDAWSSKKAVTAVTVQYADETNKAYRTGTSEAEIIKGNEKSRTLICSYSGNVSKMAFSFQVQQGEQITVRSIVLNEPVPVTFSFPRFFALWGLILLVYVFCRSMQMKKEYGDNRAVCKGAALVITLVMIFAAFGLTLSYNAQTGVPLGKEFLSQSGNQITQELVDAFEQGKVTLDTKPSEELMALENPYDVSQRTNSGAPYLWDHVYFEGNYYSYYGIAPVLLLFLPYHLLTGFYFPTSWAVFLFGAAGLFFLSKTILAFFDKFFRKIPSAFVLMTVILSLLSCGVWFNFFTPNFYEIAQTSGFACVTAGAFFLLSSNIVGNGQISRWRVVLSGVFLSLAVLCRPTLAVYCVAAVAFLIAGFLKIKKQGLNGEAKAQKSGFWNRYGSYLLCAAVPFIVIGGIQMIYNNMRFGSFMDFGIDYSLTINDFTRSQYDTRLAAIGVYNFLFAFPGIDASFPFIHSTFSTLDINGYYFVANQTSIGLFFRALPMFSYLFCYKAYRIVPKEKRRGAALLLLLSCAAAPLIIIVSIWESGYGVRYCTDFSWQLLLGAFAIAFTIYSNVKNDGVRHILNKIMVASFIIGLLVNLAFIIDYPMRSLSDSSSIKTALLSLRTTFEFWH